MSDVLAENGKLTMPCVGLVVRRRMVTTMMTMTMPTKTILTVSYLIFAIVSHFIYLTVPFLFTVIDNEPEEADPPRRRGGGNRGRNEVGETPRARREGNQGLEEAFNNLRVVATSGVAMLIYHMYSWREAVPEQEVQLRSNIRLKRLSVDVLLPGPTTLSQIEAQVLESQNKIRIKYKPPDTYLSSRRNAVRVALGLVGARFVDQTVNFTTATSRVTAHRDAIEHMSDDEKNPSFEIDLPFKVDPYFCRRDDFGIDNVGHGLDIGVYRHQDANFQANNQYVWILHIELSATERPRSSLQSPGGIAEYHNYA